MVKMTDSETQAVCSNMSKIHPSACMEPNIFMETNTCEIDASSFLRFGPEAHANAEENLETYLSALQSYGRKSCETESAVKCISVGKHTLVAGLQNGKIFVLRIIYKTVLGEEGNAEIKAVALVNEESKVMTVHSDGTLCKWDLETEVKEKCINMEKSDDVAGEEIQIVQIGGSQEKCLSAAFSSDGKFAVWGNVDYTVRIWSLDEGKEVRSLKGHTNSIVSLAVSAYGHYIISGSCDHSMKIWSFEENKELYTLTGHNGFISSVVLSADERYIVSGSSDQTVKIWSFEERKEVGSLIGHTGPILAVSMTADEKYIVSGSDDETVKIWCFDERLEVATFTGHTGLLTVALAANERYIISGCSDHSMKIWSFKEKEELDTLTGHKESISSVVLSTDGKYIVSGSSDQTVKIWSFEERKEVGRLIGHTGAISALFMTADGKYIVSKSDDNTVKIWSFDERKEVKTLIGHTGPINTVALTEGGRYIISDRIDHIVEKLQYFAKITGNTGSNSAVAVTEDGRYRVAGNIDNTLKIWSFEERKEVGRLIGHTGPISAVSMTADGRYIVSGSYDCTVKIWSFKDNKEVATLKGHTGPINTVALTACGGYIVSGSDDRTVKIWSLFSSISLFFHPVISPPIEFVPDIFVFNIPRWTAGSNIANCANYWYLRQKFINSLHIYSYYNHDLPLQSALQFGVPLFKSIFGSPITISLQRGTISCLDVILQHLINIISQQQSDAWSKLEPITDDLLGILKCDSANVYPFVQSLLCSPAPQKMPSMILPKSDLPIIITRPFRLINLDDFQKSSEPQNNQCVVHFSISLIKYNTAFGSISSLDLLRALLSAPTRKIMRTLYVKTLLDMKWKQARPIFLVFTVLYALMLTDLVCIIFQYWRVDVLYFCLLFLNFLLCLRHFFKFMLGWEKLRIRQTLQTRQTYWSYIKELFNDPDYPSIRSFMITISIVLNIAWCIKGITGYFNEYLTLVVIMLNFFNGFAYFRCFTTTRIFVSLTEHVILNVSSFLVVLAFSVLSFGLMASVFVENQLLTRSWTVAFSQLMGDFDDSQFTVTQWLIFMAACVVNGIIMLNLLIAILSDAYEKAQMTMSEDDYYQMLEVCYDMECFCFWRRKSGLPTVIMSCMPGGRSDKKDKEWTGRVAQITKQVKSQLGKMEEKFDQMEVKIERKLGGIEEKFGGMEAKISGMETKLDALMALLRSSS